MDTTATILRILPLLASVVLRRGDTRHASSLFAEGLRSAEESADTILTARCMSGLGAVAIAQGNTSRAARLLASAEVLFSMSSGLDAEHLDEHTARVALVRSSLAPIQFDAAWAEGTATTAERAVAYALESTNT